MSLEGINRLVQGCISADGAGQTKLVEALQQFVGGNQDPSHSANYRSGACDDLSALAAALQDPLLSTNRALVSGAVKVLKIASRKQLNQRTVRPAEVQAVLKVLQEAAGPDAMELRTDACNFLLNVCYHRGNIPLALPALPAVGQCLAAPDGELVVAAAGALQCMCGTDEGKQALARAPAVLSRVILLLQDSINLRVVQRCIGTLHNATSDLDAVVQIRDNNGIAAVVGLLQRPVPTGVKRHAASVLQNMSREKTCLPVIRELGAVPALTELLFVNDVQCQTSAAGALLNIQGQSGDRGTARRAAFRTVLSDCLVVGMVLGALQEALPQLPSCTATQGDAPAAPP
eukprot:RCo042631